MNFFNTLSSRLVSRGVNTNSLVYINQSNVSLTLDISGTLVTDYNDISYGSTAYGLRNAGFLIVRDSNGDYLQASDMVQSPFQGFSVYMKYKIRDVMNPNVLNLYGAPNPKVSLYTSHTTIQQGTSLQITVFQTGYVNLPYTISGVTSADLSGASLSGSLSDIYTVLSYDIQPSIQTGTMVFAAGDSSLNIDIYETYYVKTVQNVVGQTVYAMRHSAESEFLIQPSLSFSTGDKFLFDVSDPTMNNYSLVFGTTLDVSQSIVYDVFSESNGIITLDISSGYTGDALVYFDLSYSNMGSTSVPTGETLIYSNFTNTDVLTNFTDDNAVRVASDLSFQYILTTTDNPNPDYSFANGFYEVATSYHHYAYTNQSGDPFYLLIDQDTSYKYNNHWHVENGYFNFIVTLNDSTTLEGVIYTIEMPYKMKVTEMYTSYRYVDQRHAEQLWLLGTNNTGTTWDIIKSDFDHTSQNSYSYTDTVTSSTSYNMFAILVKNTIDPRLHMNKWYLTGDVYEMSDITTFTITVSNEMFYIQDDTTYLTPTQRPNLTFVEGSTYVFDQSDATNIGNQLVIGTTPDVISSIISYQTIVGTPGQPGAYTSFTATSDTVYYFSYNNIFLGSQQTSIVGFNAHDLSMAYSQYLYLPYLTDSGIGGSTVTYSVTSPDNTTATVTEDFVNIDQSGSYTVVATKSGDGIYPDVSSTCHVSLTTSATDVAHLTSMPYFSVSRVHEDNTHRYFLANLWPSFEGWDTDDYSQYGFPQTPIPRGFFEKLVSLKLPKTPSYPQDLSTCQYFSSEFGDSTEISYNTLDDLPAQFYVTAILGRLSTPNVHWSDTNTPSEMVILDPLPAACGGKYLDIPGSNVVDEQNGQNDILTATACGPTWDTKYVTPTGPPGNKYDSFSESDVSGTFYRPGYYFRYYLNGIQNDTWTQLQMDPYGGHIQPDHNVSGDLYGDWHAHTGNQIFGSTDYSNCVIGYGVDGTPIMGGGSTVYNVSGDVLGIATPSWRRRVYPGEYDTAHSQDGNGFYIYDYIQDSTVSGANLDEFNGGYAHLDGATTYAYFITQTYPIWPRNIRGAVNSIQYDETSHMIKYSVSLNSPSDADPYYIFTDTDGNNGTPILQRGQTYRFTRTDNNHPFNIGNEWKQNNTGIVVTSTGASNTVNGANSIVHGEHLTFTIPSDFSGTLKYFCYLHSYMVKAFVIA